MYKTSTDNFLRSRPMFRVEKMGGMIPLSPDNPRSKHMCTQYERRVPGNGTISLSLYTEVYDRHEGESLHTHPLIRETRDQRSTYFRPTMQVSHISPDSYYILNNHKLYHESIQSVIIILL